MLSVLASLTLSAAFAEDPSEDEEPERWDVNAPPGEPQFVDLDLTEATWMSLDVHPDGDRIVFDLLGDLYELPIDGGEARSITSGMAWDMQPLYTPDGEGLVFTSDRGGGDNLWRLDLSDRDGEPTPITDESFRLLNSPAVWDEWVVGRKHFTNRRSLGAGEIWLYHLNDEKASGLQLTERQNDQKDTGEPAFSPDGRYVYWSRDATPGEYFEYNKDSNSGIYVIERLDREDGRIERVVGGAGGAIRPTPHPDGRHLAYVRRIRHRSVLMVHDMETGREHLVWDGLDRDMQETWAIHGVYPRFSWTPDGSDIVIWAQGGLWRVPADPADLAARSTPLQPVAAERIPFHVTDRREVREPLRFQVDVAPDTFDVKMIRNARTAPDGRAVVFEALGRLWIKALNSDDEPVPLTRAPEGTRELEPSWSRDGKRVVYVEWSDTDLATIKIARPAGGTSTGSSQAVATPPGHYREPVFGPQGRRIAYRKTRGGGLISALHGKDPGLYVLDWQDRRAEPLRVARAGMSPHFGADPDVLYHLMGGDTLKLAALDLVTRESVTHATSEMATDLRVSPDGRWLAWQEDHDVHVRPFAPTGDAESISPGGGGIPQATVSDIAGMHLHFSGEDATTRVHWTVGPDLFSTAISPSIFDEEPPEPSRESLGWTEAAVRPDATVALVDVRLITMRETDDGFEVIEDGTVVWAGDRITAIGPTADTPVPDGAIVLQGEGRTVIPGLVDAHAHGPHGRGGLIPEQNYVQLANLAFGVTTIHDPSNDTGEIFTAAEMQRAGLTIAPRIFSTGTILYGAKIPGATAKIDSLDDALGHVKRMKSVGAISVKSYNQPRRDQRQQVLEAGRQEGIMVVPEGGSLLLHNLTMIIDGHTTVEHAIPVQRAYDDILQLWSQQPVAHTPTLGVAYGGLMGEEYWYAMTEVWNEPRLLTFVPRWTIDPRARRRELSPTGEYNHVDVARFAKQLADAGGRVNIGAHGQREGLAAHWELWMFEQGGMSPLEAIRAGTRHPAESLGLAGDIGTLEVGKLADMVVLASNPLDDLKNSTDIDWTVLGGQVWNARTMQPMQPAGPVRPPLWFESQGTNWRP
jgi:imidazolonepropionase-like amidohydrolase/Tol biopolymer transport system component